MITLNKEIKAFTVLENTPTTFKMEVEINTATNIDITVDRTNNNKVTATNKQGERIIVLPYLVIEAKRLANDNKLKINLVKTNFDYHKYDKKQVLPKIEVMDMYGEEILEVVHSLDNTENELSVEYFETEGLIGFNAIIYNKGVLTVDDKFPKYIILTEKVTCDWSSYLENDITDDENEMEKMHQIFENIANETIL